jgi:hypothetical protein
MTGRAVARLLTATTATAFAILAWAAPANAEVSGNCDALIKGVSAHDRSSTDPGQAIKVQPDETVDYSVASATGITQRRFLMEYAGISIVVDKGTNKGDSTFSSGSAAVKDYAWLGAGLYKASGEATLKNGTTCSGAVLVDVAGNPLTTVLGVTGVIFVVIGLIGVIASSGTGSGQIIDELVGFVTGPGAPDPATATAGGGLLAPTGAEGANDPASAGTTGTTGTEAGDEPPKRKGHRGPGAGGADPAVAAGVASGGVVGGGGSTDPATPPAAHTSGRGGTAAAAAAAAAAAGAAGSENGSGGDAKAAEEPKPPPLPGMGLVTGTGEKADALIQAHETLTNAIGGLPISEEQQTKLTESLGLDKIKEKLDQVKEVTDTVTHFEEVGTETVDTLNRWGVPPKMVEAVLWTRWTMEASGRATQKFTDGIVTPVLEPVTKALGEAGVKADATEIAHAILPVQEFAEEASKAAMTSVKNVLGGDNIVGQLGKDPVVDEEWANIRTFK